METDPEPLADQAILHFSIKCNSVKPQSRQRRGSRR